MSPGEFELRFGFQPLLVNHMFAAPPTFEAMPRESEASRLGHSVGFGIALYELIFVGPP